MRTAAVILAALAVVPAASAGAAPRVSVLVVGKSSTLRGPVSVKAPATKVAVGGKRCRVGAGTPIAALARVAQALGLHDYGSCSSRAADGGGLFVTSVAGETARRGASDGWVYKVGNAAPGVGGADPSSAVRSGSRVLWFWCHNGSSGCQRTLAVKPLGGSVAAGGTLRVKVTAYDDNGAGAAASGASVSMGSAVAVAGADGVATVTAPSQTGTLDVVATQNGRVRSFPARVRVR